MASQTSMRYPRTLRCIALAAFLAVTFALPPAHLAQAYPYNPVATQPGFTKGLVLPGGPIAYASPASADLDKDGKQEIVVGASDGKVYAIRPDGTLLWVFDTTGPINALAPRPDKTYIDSVPAVGDLDNDGWSEVAIGAGAPASLSGYNGAMLVLSHDGQLRPGWPQLGVDQIGPGMGGPDGLLEGFYSSPSLADLDGDGDLEIVVGGWDMRFYAWHHDGRLVAGWPRFASDTVWSSPATADIDDDGRPEVIIGRDSGQGGFLEVLRGDGSKQPGFPKQIDQTVFASPAVADLNGDGRLDIVSGTGSFYEGRGMAVYAWDGNGDALPGWPVTTGGPTTSSPSVGDLDGDGGLEVVVGANDGKAYAFHANGQPVAGWPVLVQDNFGNKGALQHAAPVLANFDRDPQPEVFINSYCDTVVIDGNGTLLTHVGSSGASGKPSMYMFDASCHETTPVVADLEGDGRTEVVRAGGVYNAQTKQTGNGLVYVWEFSPSSTAAPWPMRGHDPLHRGIFQPRKPLDARLVDRSLPDLLADGQSSHVRVTFENTGTDTWTAAKGIHLQAAADNTLMPGQTVALSSSDSIAPGQRKTFEFEITAKNRSGYAMGSWRMADAAGRLFGPSAWREVKVGAGVAYYVLSRASNSSQGAVYAGGLATQLSLPAGYWNWPEVKDLVVTAGKQGYEMLDSQGCVWNGGSAPAIAVPTRNPDAVELLMREDQSTYYYVLDRYGRLIRSAGAPEISPAPPVQGAPTVRAGVLTPDGKGVYVLLGDGVILRGGNAPALEGAPYFGEDIAKKIHLAPSGKGAYVLDAYGRVWPVGGAPVINPKWALHMGEDWARDLDITQDGRGVYVLDKEGGIHPGGTAPALSGNSTPVWPGQDVAVALVMTETRAPRTLVLSPPQAGVLTTPNTSKTLKLSVGMSDESTVSWRASSSASWARLQTTSGRTPATLAIDVQSGGLAPGSYRATIEVEDADGVYGQRTVTLQLTVSARLYKMSLPMIIR